MWRARKAGPLNSQGCWTIASTNQDSGLHFWVAISNIKISEQFLRGTEGTTTPSTFSQCPPIGPGSTETGDFSDTGIPATPSPASTPQGCSGRAKSKHPSSISSSHPSLGHWLPVKYLCGQMAENHLVHFWIHERATLRGAGFVQGHVNQRPACLPGVGWWRCKRGNDLPFLVSLNNKDRLKTNGTCFPTLHTATLSLMENWAPLFLAWGPGHQPRLGGGGHPMASKWWAGSQVAQAGVSEASRKSPADVVRTAGKPGTCAHFQRNAKGPRSSCWKNFNRQWRKEPSVLASFHYMFKRCHLRSAAKTHEAAFSN